MTGSRYIDNLWVGPCRHKSEAYLVGGGGGHGAMAHPHVLRCIDPYVRFMCLFEGIFPLDLVTKINPDQVGPVCNRFSTHCG